MNKIAYEILVLEIDKLYPPHYILKPGQKLDDHLDYIETFIESCGWDVDEFIAEYNHRTMLVLNPVSN